MKKCFLYYLLCQLLVFNSDAQTDTSWFGKKCAVVLTYDDGLNIDLSNVLPALDSAGLKGTFYISDYFTVFIPRLPGGEPLPKEDMNWRIIPYTIPVPAARREESL